MKHSVLVIASCLSVAGCAKIHVKKWDHDSVTVCGNRWAKEETLAAAAKEKCGSEVELAGGNSEVAGSVDSGYGTTSVVHHDCSVYRCKR